MKVEEEEKDVSESRRGEMLFTDYGLTYLGGPKAGYSGDTKPH